jgi:hypothetical protein
VKCTLSGLSDCQIKLGTLFKSKIFSIEITISDPPKLNMDEKGNSLNYIIYLPVAQQIITSQPEELFPSDLLNHYIYFLLNTKFFLQIMSENGHQGVNILGVWVKVCFFNKRFKFIG